MYLTNRNGSARVFPQNIYKNIIGACKVFETGSDNINVGKIET
jgi:hypothetical protein